jgi:hypothetical protein
MNVFLKLVQISGNQCILHIYLRTTARGHIWVKDKTDFGTNDFLKEKQVM